MKYLELVAECPKPFFVFEMESWISANNIHSTENEPWVKACVKFLRIDLIFIADKAMELIKTKKKTLDFIAYNKTKRIL